MAEKEVKILVIDDEEFILNVLQKALEKMGYAAKAAATCDEAFEYTNKENYDLIIIDLSLCASTGNDKMSQLYTKYKNKIVLMTGNSTSETAESVINATGAPCLLKPFSLPELKEFITKKLDEIKE